MQCARVDSYNAASHGGEKRSYATLICTRVNFKKLSMGKTCVSTGSPDLEVEFVQYDSDQTWIIDRERFKEKY